jgi:biopolymer transport protein ExbD
MKLKEETTAPDVRVDIIPLIDVIFCILTFFILAALGLTRQQAINVDLPRASTGVSQMRQMLIVSVDPIGQTYIDQQPVTQEQLQQVLQDYQQKNPEGLMVLYASRNASYSDVVGVLDLLRSVGGDRVALATLPDSPQGTQSFPPGTLPNPSGQNAPLDSPFSLPGSGLSGSDNSGSGLPAAPSLGLPGSSGSYNPNLFPGSQPLPTAPGTSAPGTSAPSPNALPSATKTPVTP